MIGIMTGVGLILLPLAIILLNIVKRETLKRGKLEQASKSYETVVDDVQKANAARSDADILVRVRERSFRD